MPQVILPRFVQYAVAARFITSCWLALRTHRSASAIAVMVHSTRSGADAVMQTAAEAGVTVCFANPGTTEMHLVGALEKLQGAIRPVLCLHENVCTGAADGFARMARRPAMTLLHLGPGLANGLANLHNARRASSPVLNIVGSMATWHEGADPLLAMPIEGIAHAVSTFVRTSATSRYVVDDVTAAIAALRAPTGAGASQVATLVVPHDLAWTEVPAAPHRASAQIGEQSGGPAAIVPKLHAFLTSCGAALKAEQRGKAALYLGGAAVLEQGDAMLNAGRIAAATGAVLLSENFFARVDRGAHTPRLKRLPYFPQHAQAELAKYSLLICIDARRPVAMFGYEGGPSQLIGLHDDNIWELDSASCNIAEALAFLSDLVGGPAVKPGINCGGVFATAQLPPLPSGKLTAGSLCAAIAHLQPEGAVIVDESLTSGGAYWELSRGCPSFSHLTLTGGAIGCGPPMAVGAAIACPERTIINIQADGSAMYSLQALWTQAREGLKVITVICANQSYAILQVEVAKQRTRVGSFTKSLTELNRPSIDWTALAVGMGVPGSLASTVDEFCQMFQMALLRDGPALIEARLC